MYDVAIIGGGLVGPLLAIILKLAGFRVAIIEKEKKESLLEKARDGRTIAVSYGSSLLFKEAGLWAELECDAEPIQAIRILEQDSPWILDYEASLLDGALHGAALGYIVEHASLRRALYNALEESVFPDVEGNAGSIISLFENQCLDVRWNGVFSTLFLQDNMGAKQEIKASLIVGAEGRFSKTRLNSSIAARTFDYKETALVLHLAHEKPHNQTAWEIFTKEGLLAILPLSKREGAPFRSGLVFTKPKGTRFDDISDDDLLAELQKIFPYYGNFSVDSTRWTYNLAGLRVDRLYEEGYVIVGDAAHVIHPMAGQGVNLGWQDIAVLKEELVTAKSLGLSLGSLTVLSQYEKKRLSAHKKLFYATHGIHKLFKLPSCPFYWIRNGGFALINRLPLLKKRIMKEAMGL